MNWLRRVGLLCSFLVLCLCQVVATENGRSSSTGSLNTNSLKDELMQAVSSNNVLQVRAILQAEPTLANATNNMGEPVLVRAASQGNVEAVKALLDAGASVDAMGWQHNTALYTTLSPMLSYRRFRGIANTPPPAPEAALAMARLLLERGASIFSALGYGQTVIGSVAQGHDGDLADFLLVQQHSPKTKDLAGNSVVHLAALWGRTNALRALAEKKANLEATNAAGLTPLQAVARLPDARGEWLLTGWTQPGLDADGPKLRQTTAQLLVVLGASRDIFSATALSWTNAAVELIKSQPDLVRRRDAAGQTPLYWAAEFDQVEIAMLLLKAGSLTESGNHQGQTPLDVAAAKGHTDVAKLLLSSGASVTRSQGIKTPLHWAAEQGNMALIDVLLNAGADPNAEDGHHQSPLDSAARENQERVVKWLLVRHARLKTGGKNLTIPLHWATANANTNLITLLLQKGSDINARNEEGKTPLHLAHERDNFGLLEFLLARDAHVNARDTNGNTVLHVRAAAGSDRFAILPGPAGEPVDKAPASPAIKQSGPPALLPKPPTRSMMEFLLKHGAQLKATNFSGETPLHRVALKSFEGTNAVADAQAWIRPLLRWHASLNARDLKGRSPLHLAVQRKNLPVIQSLLDGGADANRGDADGSAPLHLAVREIDPFGASLPVVEMLLKGGAKANSVDSTGATPLHLAVAKTVPREAERPIVALLLANGAKVNALDKEGHAPLHLASGLGSCPSYNALLHYNYYLPGASEPFDLWCGEWEHRVEEAVPMMLLTNGASVNIPDHLGNTPLHYAAEAVRVDLVKLLLEHKADRRARNHAGRTPLQIAYEQARGFIVIPLLQPANVSGEIADAAQRGDIAMVKAFLEDDPRNANRPWVFNSTPLQWASNHGHLAVVELLLKCGAAVDPPQPVRTPRTRMIEFNALMNCLLGESNRLWSARMASGLHEPPKDLDRSDAAETESKHNPFSERDLACVTLTPLQLSLAGGHTNIARLLIKHGAKIDLASAASLGLVAVLERAIRAEAQRVDEFSRRALWLYECREPKYAWHLTIERQSGTLLHFAVRARQQKAVEFLLGAGANPSIPDDEGRTPYQLAVEEGRSDIATFLEQHGADGRRAPR